MTNLSREEGSATDREITEIRDTHNLRNVQTIPRPRVPSMPREIKGREGQNVKIPCKYPPTAEAVRWSKYTEKTGAGRQPDFQLLAEIDVTSGEVKVRGERTGPGLAVESKQGASTVVLVIS